MVNDMTQMSIIHMPINGRRFYFRENNFGDQYVIVENIRRNQYHLLLKPHDVVLDIGGHIGSFAVSIASSVAEVISIEMDDENFALLKTNAEQYENIIAVNAACVGKKTGDTEYYRAAKNSGATSRYIKRGRGEPLKAPTITLGELVNTYNPTVIKCDVEGSEYEIFSSDIPAGVSQIAIEFHLGTKNFKLSATELYQKMLTAGFSTEEFDFQNTKHWTKVMTFRREL